jgi:hypothetical protein
LVALVEERRGLIDSVVGLTNQLTNTLKQYYPQALDGFEHRDILIICNFLSHWPTLKHVQRARLSTLESLYRQHNANRAYLVEERIQVIRSATALTKDGSVIQPNQAACDHCLPCGTLTTTVNSSFVDDYARISPIR